MSLGPLLLGHETQPEDSPCVKLNASKSQHGIKIHIGFFFFLAFMKCFCPSVPGCGVHAFCHLCHGAFHPGANSLVKHQEGARITDLTISIN